MNIKKTYYLFGVQRLFTNHWKTNYEQLKVVSSTIVLYKYKLSLNSFFYDFQDILNKVIVIRKKHFYFIVNFI